MHSTGVSANGLNGTRFEDELDRRVMTSLFGVMTAELLKTFMTVARTKISTPKNLGAM